jgi:hypothetical protein
MLCMVWELPHTYKPRVGKLLLKGGHTFKERSIQLTPGSNTTQARYGHIRPSFTERKC